MCIIPHVTHQRSITNGGDAIWFCCFAFRVMTQTTAEGHLKMAFPCDKIIILFVLLNTLSSLVSISASAGLFEFCMHDGLITLGIFRLSHWIKSRMVTTAIKQPRHDRGRFFR